MTSSTTSNVYIHVIEDVINKVSDEFISNGGPGEGVLTELRALWELKMMQAGAILGPIDRSSNQQAGTGGGPNSVRDLNINVPYESTEEYETPTTDLLFPPTPLQTPMPTPLTGHTPLPAMPQTPLTAQTTHTRTDGSSMYNNPTGGSPTIPNEYTSTIENGGVPGTRAGLGRPNPHMPPPSGWLNQRPSLDVNVAYVEGREEDGERGAPHQPTTQDFFQMPSGKRKREDFPPPYHASRYIPQQDGAGDFQLEELKVQGSVQQMFVQSGTSSSRIPQLDGPIPDPYDDVLSTPNIYNYQGVVNEDYNTVNTPMPELQAQTPAPVQNDVYDDDDEPLNEDDDEDDLDDVDNGEDLNTTHLVLAQFDKVTRTKSRWKCTLKDGIMHINNKDILFNKATGEFDF